MELNFMAKSAVTFALAGATAVLMPGAYADTVSINFDSLNTLPPVGGGVVAFTGPALTGYLAGYGVSTSNLSPGSFMYVANLTGLNNVLPPSSPNALSQASGSASHGSSFTMNFANPVNNFSFIRSRYVAAFSPNGTVLGDWSATAYSSANVALGSVGEGLIATYGDIPFQTFSLGVSGISYINFTANAHGFAGQEMPWIDNISFETTMAAPVPEPETYAMLLAGLGLLGFVARRRQLTEAAPA